MTELALVDLDELTGGELEPEMLLDPYNPKNDRYYQGLDDVRRRIAHQKSQMKPKQVTAVKLALSGLSGVRIAEKIKVSSNTVSKWLNSPAAIRLGTLLDTLNAYLDGPNKEHRKHMLWRIAVDNEELRPSTTISAVQEINKMSGSYEPSSSGSQINITINSELLPHGELDKLPKTYDSTAHLEKDGG